VVRARFSGSRVSGPYPEEALRKWGEEDFPILERQSLMVNTTSTQVPIELYGINLIKASAGYSVHGARKERWPCDYIERDNGQRDQKPTLARRARPRYNGPRGSSTSATGSSILQHHEERGIMHRLRSTMGRAAFTIRNGFD